MVQEETLDFSGEAVLANVLNKKSFYEILEFYVLIFFHRFDYAGAQVRILLDQTGTLLNFLGFYSQL